MSAGRAPKAHLSAAMGTLDRAQQVVSDRLDAFNDATDAALAEISLRTARDAPQVARLADDLSWAVSAAIDKATEGASTAVMREYEGLQQQSGSPQTMWLPYRWGWLFSAERMRGFGRGLIEWNSWFDYEAVAGSKNLNYPLRLVDGRAMVRRPLSSITDDPVMFAEAEIASILHRPGVRSIELLGLPAPGLAIYAFVDGTDLGVTNPIGTPLPSHVIGDDIEYQAALCAVSEDAVARLTGGDQRPRSTHEYYAWFDDEITRLRERRQLRYGDLYRDLHVPLHPWERRDGGDWQPRGERRLGIVHGDLHRFNRRIKDGQTFYIDPELAVWGDPLREVTHNLHLTKHDDDEKRRYLDGWEAALPTEYTRDWRDDFDDSLGRSQIASAVLDPSRWAVRWNIATDGEKTVLAEQLGNTLNVAYRFWDPDFTITDDQVVTALDRWAADRLRR